MKLLKEYYTRGLGGVLLEDVQESLPRYEKIMKKLKNKITIVMRPDKKRVAFYRDRSLPLKVNYNYAPITIFMFREVKIVCSFFHLG